MSFAPKLEATRIAAGKQRQRQGQLWPGEIITILIHFHQSHYRTFKAYYTEHVQVYRTSEFPHLASYPRFVALIPSMLVPLLAYLQSFYGDCTEISFIDSISLEVCDPKRIHQHRVFAIDAGPHIPHFENALLDIQYYFCYIFYRVFAMPRSTGKRTYHLFLVLSFGRYGIHAITYIK